MSDEALTAEEAEELEWQDRRMRKRLHAREAAAAAAVKKADVHRDTIRRLKAAAGAAGASREVRNWNLILAALVDSGFLEPQLGADGKPILENGEPVLQIVSENEREG